jgi:hypothetical protein
MGLGMGLGACMKCIKYSLFIFNFIFWLIGAALLSFGLWLYFAPGARQMLHTSGDSVGTLALIVIVIGSIIMLLGFLGCCGSILENKCMLVVFFILMTLIFLAVLTAGLLLVFMWNAFRNPAIEMINWDLLNKTKIYETDEGVRTYLDQIQTSLHCCGAEGPADYHGTSKPTSCHAYTEGCTRKIEEKMDDVWLKIVIAFFTTAFVALVGMVISMMLCCALRDEYD